MPEMRNVAASTYMATERCHATKAPPTIKPRSDAIVPAAFVMELACRAGARAGPTVGSWLWGAGADVAVRGGSGGGREGGACVGAGGKKKRRRAPHWPPPPPGWGEPIP